MYSLTRVSSAPFLGSGRSSFRIVFLTTLTVLVFFSRSAETGGGAAPAGRGMREPGILRSASLTFRSNRRREAPTAEALASTPRANASRGFEGGARGVSVRATRPNVSICGSKRGSRQRTCHEGIGGED